MLAYIVNAHAELLAAPLDDLLAQARRLRRGPLVTYSPKVFIPLTTLCRDVCSYCTFARPPRRLRPLGRERPAALVLRARAAVFQEAGDLGRRPQRASRRLGAALATYAIAVATARTASWPADSPDKAAPTAS